MRRIIPEHGRGVIIKSQYSQDDREGDCSERSRETPGGFVPEQGILFVHGIGQQKRGETLLAFGEPLHDWLQRRLDRAKEKWLDHKITKDELKAWLENLTPDGDSRERDDLLQPLLEAAREGTPLGGNQVRRDLRELRRQVGYDFLVARVDIREATLRRLPHDRQAPAHATIELRVLTLDGKVERSQWLLAESCWAAAFPAAGYLELVRWGASAVPWTIASHFAARFRRALKEVGHSAGAGSILRLVISFLWLVACPTITFVVYVLLVVLAILALVPYSRLRSVLRLVQSAISESIGDAYVLVSRQLHAAAIVAHVRRDLGWLAARCGKVVLIAHSQGGAVAHLLMRSPVPAHVKHLVTFGSGLRKLEELRRITINQKRLARMVVAFMGLAALSVPIGMVAAWPLVVIAGIAAASSLLAVLLAAVAMFTAGESELRFWADRFTSQGFTWQDYYASADPVPNGSLFDDVAPLEKGEVHNLGSMLWDHTSYWRNVDGFVTQLAAFLAKDTRLERRITPRLTEQSKTASDQRAWRVGWLKWSRVLATALTLVVLCRRWPDLPLLADSFFALVTSGATALSAPLGTSTHTFFSGIGVSWKQAAGLLLGAMLAWILYGAWSSWLWGLWNRSDINAFFAGTEGLPEYRLRYFLVWAALVGASFAIGIAMAFGVSHSRRNVLLYLGIGLVVGLAVAGVSFLSLRWKARKTDKEYAQTPEFGQQKGK